MDIREVIKRPEYNFLETDKKLGKNIMLLTYGGSHAYGLNTPTSDIDIRGILAPTKEDLFGPTAFVNPQDEGIKNYIFGPAGFEQYLEKETDTTLYSLNKMIGLLYKCNPNTIEILGCKPDHYAIITDEGRMLLNNYEVFLSKKAYYTFVSYARGQLQRLKNALSRDRSTAFVQQLNLIDRINRMDQHLESAFPSFRKEMIRMYITDLDGNELLYKGQPLLLDDVKAFCYDIDDEWDLQTLDGTPINPNNVQLMLDLKMDSITPKDYFGVTNEINAVVKDFNSHTGHRNNKKDDYHLNKHAMHLIRLFLMAEDILKEKTIVTYREKDLDFLLSIKNGYYMREDGTYKPEFFEMVDRYSDKLLEIHAQSKLPESPDRNKIIDLSIAILESVVSKFEPEYINKFNNMMDEEVNKLSKML